MSNTAALEEAAANGWLDADDLAALDRKPLEDLLQSESDRQKFYDLSLEGRCAMFREMVWNPESPC